MLRTSAITLLSALLLSGCASQTESAPAATATVKTVTLAVGAVSWKNLDGSGGSCAEGLEIADFWKDRAPVNVYDDATGDLLASSVLSVNEEDPGNRICGYSTDDVAVPEVANYRFVFDGRHSVTRSAADLKIAAQEMSDRLGFEFAELYFVEEVGN